LKANVEKGFLGTAFGQELVDPKTQTNLMKCTKWNTICSSFLLY
jgi:hypothetical protein